METFYIIVLSVAISILILLLAFYGIFMNQNVKNTSAYPPQPAPTCPDYWSVATDGSCKIPPAVPSSKNLGGIFPVKLDDTGKPMKNSDGSPVYGALTLTGENTPGFDNTAPPGKIDFKHTDWSKGGTSALCNQKAWANGANVMWDGISNYNGC